MEKIVSDAANKQLPRCIGGKGESAPDQGYPAEADYGYDYEEDEAVTKTLEAVRLVQQSLLDIDAALKWSLLKIRGWAVPNVKLLERKSTDLLSILWWL